MYIKEKKGALSLSLSDGFSVDGFSFGSQWTGRFWCVEMRFSPFATRFQHLITVAMGCFRIQPYCSPTTSHRLSEVHIKVLDMSMIHIQSHPSDIHGFQPDFVEKTHAWGLLRKYLCKRSYTFRCTCSVAAVAITLSLSRLALEQLVFERTELCMPHAACHQRLNCDGYAVELDVVDGMATGSSFLALAISKKHRQRVCCQGEEGLIMLASL